MDMCRPCFLMYKCCKCWQCRGRGSDQSNSERAPDILDLTEAHRLHGQNIFTVLNMANATVFLITVHLQKSIVTGQRMDINYPMTFLHCVCNIFIDQSQVKLMKMLIKRSLSKTKGSVFRIQLLF